MFDKGNVAVRSKRWRYIRYADGSEEMYDHRTDRHEWTNLASKSDLTEAKSQLAEIAAELIKDSR